MRINNVQLSNYKQFKDFALSFGSANPIDGKNEVHILVGDNGVGKTSILQGIVATLATMTGQIPHNPTYLKWDGFNLNKIRQDYNKPCEVSVEVQLGEDELLAIKEAYLTTNDKLAKNKRNEDVILDSKPSIVRFNHYGVSSQVYAVLDRNNYDPDINYPTVYDKRDAYIKFRGLSYTYDNSSEHTYKHDVDKIMRLIKRLGGIFWYTGQRNMHSITPALFINKPEGSYTPEDFLRAILTRWFATKIGKVERFNEYFSAIFPNHQLVKIVEPRGYPRQASIIFTDGMHKYELSELSSGERAVLPILVDIVERDINHSVIIIDNIELNLRPSTLSRFYSVLPKLGNNNQFIVTTHGIGVWDTESFYTQVIDNASLRDSMAKALQDANS